MIRPATLDDVPVLTDLLMEFSSRWPEPADRESVQYYMEDGLALPNYAAFLAEAEGDPIGVIAGKVEPWVFNANILILEQIGLFVPEQTKRRHPLTAARLIQRFAEWGREYGATVIRMKAHATSHKLQRFLVKAGMQPLETVYRGDLWQV